MPLHSTSKASMAIYQYTTVEDTRRPTTATAVTTKTTTRKHPVSYSSLAFAGIGLPLLTLAGLTFLLSTTLLLISSPLLLLFSPLLLLAGTVLAGSLAGFGLAGAAAGAGLWSFAQVLRVLGWRGDGGGRSLGGVDVEGFDGRVVQETVTESRQRIREEKADFGGGYAKRRVVVYPPEDLVAKKE